MTAAPCPCCSGLLFSRCCEPYLRRKRLPETAEALMRSRYTAFATGEVLYLVETRHPQFRSATEEADIRRWIAAVTSWDSLEIIMTDQGQKKDTKGVVVFRVSYYEGGRACTFDECSLFEKEGGRWLYKKGAS